MSFKNWQTMTEIRYFVEFDRFYVKISVFCLLELKNGKNFWSNIFLEPIKNNFHKKFI